MAEIQKQEICLKGSGWGGQECKSSVIKDLNSLEYLLFTKAKILSNSQLRAKESPGTRRSLERLDMKFYFLQEGRAQLEMKCFNRHRCPSIKREMIGKMTGLIDLKQIWDKILLEQPVHSMQTK